MMDPSEFIPSEIQDSEPSYEKYLADGFDDEKTPLKIRKIELFDAVGLPIPETDLIDPQDLDQLRSAILTRRAQHEGASLIIRFACIPDRFSMPTVFVEPDSEISDVLKKINQLATQNSQIIKLILRQVVSLSDTSKKISGRLLFVEEEALPLDEILEIYKGSRSTNVFNNVDVRDPNFIQFRKNAGHFMRPSKPISENTTISNAEIQEIYTLLQGLREKIFLVREIIAKTKHMRPDRVVCCLEFSYINGKIVFSDID